MVCQEIELPPQLCYLHPQSGFYTVEGVVRDIVNLMFSQSIQIKSNQIYFQSVQNYTADKISGICHLVQKNGKHNIFYMLFLHDIFCSRIFRFSFITLAIFTFSYTVPLNICSYLGFSEFEMFFCSDICSQCIASKE